MLTLLVPAFRGGLGKGGGEEGDLWHGGAQPAVFGSRGGGGHLESGGILAQGLAQMVERFEGSSRQPVTLGVLLVGWGDPELGFSAFLTVEGSVWRKGGGSHSTGIQSLAALSWRN